MTEQEQRIAIAEACGWTFSRESLDTLTRIYRPDGGSFDGFILADGACSCSSSLPYYLHDLNAMHEAEKVFHKHLDLIVAYHDFLVAIKCREILEHSDIAGQLFHSTAAQRAEAFLRTIGKWKD